MLRSLESEGLLTRAADEKDGRKSIVSVTNKGRQVITNHADASREIFLELENRFGAKRLETLLDLLEDLTDRDGSQHPRT
jgi:DNA-binding MarR family transcriptional regulator